MTAKDVQSKINETTAKLEQLRSDADRLATAYGDAITDGQKTTQIEKDRRHVLDVIDLLEAALPRLHERLEDARRDDTVAVYRQRVAEMQSLRKEAARLNSEIVPLEDKLRPLVQAKEDVDRQHRQLNDHANELLALLRSQHGADETLITELRMKLYVES